LMLKKTLGKETLCLVSKIKHSAKKLFAECQKTLGKETICRMSKIKHSTKSFFAKCFLPRFFFAWHLANHLTLGKEPNSGSACNKQQQSPHCSCNIS
jgi:hypothetical protein